MAALFSSPSLRVFGVSTADAVNEDGSLFNWSWEEPANSWMGGVEKKRDGSLVWRPALTARQGLKTSKCEGPRKDHPTHKLGCHPRVKSKCSIGASADAPAVILNHGSLKKSGS